jgi:iron complex outermembrane receptor protein
MKTSLFTVLALSLAVNQALAATNVEPIVVSANRFATTIDTAPVNITTISAEQIANSNAANLSQLLELQAGIYINDFYGITGSRSSADMGGFGATGAHNTLVLINGRRQNDVDLSGANLAAIPLESIARVEIVHGSSAVLYGDNAVSGIINIVTKSGFEQDRTTVSATAGSFSTRGLNADYSKNYANTAAYISADAKQSDGYRDESQFDQKSLVTEVSRNSDSLNYGLRLNHFDEDLQLPGALETILYKDDPTQAGTYVGNSKQHRNGVDLFLSNENAAGELAYSNKHQEAYGTTEADLNTLSFTPRLRQTVAGHQLVGGIDAYNSQLDTRADYGTNGNKSATTRDSYALYLSDNYALNSHSSLNLGARRQWVSLEIDNDDLYSAASAREQHDDAVNAWEIGVNHRFNDSVQAHARFANSFRFAVLDEMWSYFFGTITPLKPQIGRHVEAGADIKLSPQASVKVNLFRIRLEDEIGYNASTFSNENLDPSEHQGADIDYSNQVNAMWQINFGYAYRDATFRSGANKDKQIPEIPMHRATLSNGFMIDDHNRVNADIVYTGKRYFGDDYANDGKQMPGYTRVNLGYQYKRDNWKAQLRIDNATDINTADHGYYGNWTIPPSYYYYPLPGRAYYLTVGAEF